MNVNAHKGGLRRPFSRMSFRQGACRWPVFGVISLALSSGAFQAYGQTAEGFRTQTLPAGVGSPVAETASAARTAPRSRSAVAGKPALSGEGCGSAGALGVSRTVTIDTAAGPRYGHQQFQDIDFLQDGEIVLTFDDGPSPSHTPAVLKALDAHCTKATFFVVGRMAIADPALVKEEEKRGHTVGSHTWSHADLRKTNSTRARGEMELGISAVSRALGHPSAPFFRFPYLSSPKGMLDYARGRKLGVFSIEVDAVDYRTKDPAVVSRNVLNQLAQTKKGIILFHDIQASTAGALKGLLDELKTRGYRVVHMVASTPVVTLPEFDALADKEIARKSSVAASDPLASRSVVWPIAKGPAPAGESADEMLPWGVVASKPGQAPPPPRPRATLPPPEDGDWLKKLFPF